MSDALPPELAPAMTRARKLEWWSIGWTISVIAVMGLSMGSSQTMKTAWIEDCLSLVPPIVFLFAAAIERRDPTPRFPRGFLRASSLSFAIAAAALAVLGATLLFDSVSGLVRREHATVGLVWVAGREVWLGWIMVAAQVYSIIVPYVLGRLKLPLATKLHDKTLFTDAQTQRANWLTGIAGIGGVIGIGYGYWWADAAAAGLIALDILLDGARALRAATAELIDGSPRALDGKGQCPEGDALAELLRRRYPGADVRVRETGRVMRAEVSGVAPPDGPLSLRDHWPGDPGRAWRLAEIAFAPPQR